MAAGNQIDLTGIKGRRQVLCPAHRQGIVGKAPSTEGLVVAMNAPDPQSPKLNPSEHRQRAQRRADAEVSRCLTQPADHGVGAVDIGLIDRIGIGATASGIGAVDRGLTGELGFDVPTHRMPASDTRLNRHELVGIDVEPVKVPVDNHLDPAFGLTADQRLQTGQGIGIAVQAAHHPQHIATQGRRFAKGPGVVTVVERTATARPIGRACLILPGDGHHARGLHAASAPPHELPWPAVQP